HVKFKANGEIYSDNFDINNDILKTLKLNQQNLIDNRKRILKTTLNTLATKNKGQWNKDILQREIDKWENKNNEKYKAYCQIVIYHLKKKLAQC
ncbi:MAG: TIGR02646 family protein, partial [Methylococcaceae bacterium]|nr:TIGR02646 family protein [Methylococcaceae bacterium]